MLLKLLDLCTLACLVCSSILGKCYLHIPGVLFALRRRPFGTHRIPLGGRRSTFLKKLERRGDLRCHGAEVPVEVGRSGERRSGKKKKINARVKMTGAVELLW